VEVLAGVLAPLAARTESLLPAGPHRLLQQAVAEEPPAGSRVHDATLVADDTDDLAVRLIMGHALGHIEQFYIEGLPVAIDRLRKVTGRVRKWLYSK
jgi:hypothetical protein